MENEAAVLYVVFGALGIGLSMVITYFFFRWLFAIDKRVKQNDEIIELLKKLQK